VAIVLTVLSWVSWGCGVGESLLPEAFSLCPAPPPPPEPPAGLTYYRDVKPILDARCGGCHADDGIAPFSLTNPEDAVHHADLAADAVEDRRMPPWQPSDCCQDYRWRRSISEEEIATLDAWAAQGAPVGDPADEGAPLPTERAALERVDLTLRMAEPYTPSPTIGRDDVRCFQIDWPVDQQIFVTGLDVRPGNRTMVHHLTIFLADAGDDGELRALDDASAGPGWDCGGFGGEFRAQGFLGGWTPGQGAITFPEGLGREAPAGSTVVLQIHYDTGRGIDADQTEIDLMLAEQVETELRNTAVGNPQWLIEGGMRIAAGDPDAMFWFAYDPTTVIDRDGFLIRAVNIHMHELGSRASLAILRAGGETECLLHIPAWDFHWLSDYWLREPVRLYPGDQLYVECHFDNTAENQKIVDGQQLPPRDLDWGTDEEMCGGILVITDPEAS
jgi:hypothetical protein